MLSATEIRKKLLYDLSHVCTTEEYGRGKAALDEMSDETLLNYAAICAASSQHTQGSSNLKELIHELVNVRERRGFNSEESALHLVPAKSLPCEDAEHLLAKIKKTMPSDAVHLTYESDRRLVDLWRKDTKGVVPSNLFFEKTVPMLDIRIVVDEQGAYKDDPGLVCTYRIVIFEDYKDIIDKATEDKFVYVGAFIDETLASRGYEFFLPLAVIKGVPYIGTFGYGWFGKNKIVKERFAGKITQQTLADKLVEYMSTWYGIQTAFLHPTIKSVMQNPKMEKNRNIPDNRLVDSSTRRVKYIKRHVIKQTTWHLL